MTDGVHGNDLSSDYRDPVRQMLHIGNAGEDDPAEWPDYAAEFGVGHQHIDALIRMACDIQLYHGDPDSSEAWAPVHAWRALGQLRAEAAVEQLLALLNELLEDETACLELPVVFGMIGPAAIPHIAKYLSNRKNPESPAGTAMAGLHEIAARHADCRGECIDVLSRTLEPHADTNCTMNGLAVSALIDLHAVEFIDPIRDAFQRNAVDLSIAGDIEDVEIELGLRNRRATPRPRYAILPEGWSPQAVTDRLQPNLLISPRRAAIGRNDPCPCGSGKKFKKCCLQ
jgi:hypothetical protein